MSADTANQILKILHENYAITGDAESKNLLEKYRFNSVDALDFLLRVESAFGIMIPDDRLSSALLADEDELVTFVDTLRAEQGSI